MLSTFFRRSALLLAGALIASADPVDNVYGLFFSSDSDSRNVLTINGSIDLPLLTGWWSPQDGHSSDNLNYIVGNADGSLYNDFFVVDLSSITGPITSASLNLVTFYAPGPTVTFTLFDVSTPIPELTADAISTEQALNIYYDLSSGVSYGQLTVGDPFPEMIHLELNAAGVAALNNALGGTIALGGTVSPSAIPEPSTYAALLGAAALATVIVRRRRGAGASARLG